MIDKFVRSVAEALEGIKDGSVVLIAGFAQVGEPRVRKIVCSFARSRGSVLLEEVYARGEIELEIVPQGTMAERIRAGAAGIPAYFTATAAGTKLAQGKEARTFNGREYILEE